MDRQHGAATIGFFKTSIECEIAAVATNPDYARFHLPEWVGKIALDLTLVDTVAGDGKATVLITNPTLPTIFPAASLTGKLTHTGHVDFAVSIPEAIAKYGTTCQGSDPSQSHLGLATWIVATLDQISPESHGGLSYTVDVDVTASVGSRFGYVFSIVNVVDAGFSYTREGQHHLVVTMSEPTPASGPLPVRIVGPVSVVESSPAAGLEPKLVPPKVSGSPGARAKVGPPSRPRNPALDDPNLNRLLQQQAPVRLAPGTVLR